MKMYIFTFFIIKYNNDFFNNGRNSARDEAKTWKKSLLTYVLSFKSQSGFSIKIKAL